MTHDNPSDNKAQRVDTIRMEYESLKAEQTHRIGFRDNMLFVHLAAVGAVFAWSLTPASSGSQPPALWEPAHALLIIPWICVILGWTYLANDHIVSRIGRYVRFVITPRLNSLVGALPTITVDAEAPIVESLGWEPFHRLDKRRMGRKRVQWIVDLLTFCAPGLLALWLRWWSTLPMSYNDYAVAGVELLALTFLAYSITAYADIAKG